MKKYRKIISMMTVAALVVPVLEYGSVPVSAQEKKQYVIMAETDEAFEVAVEEAGDSVAEDALLFLENNVVVAELTEKEAATLESKDILVEEDIVLTASTEEEEDPELTVEEARKRKEEMKRKKTEQYQKLEDEAANQEGSGTQEEDAYEWNLQAIRAQDLENGNTKVKVAVLDSGVDFVEGIELAGYVNLVEEEDYVVPVYQDLTGHGTGIAGIIAGDGTDGFYGVNPNAELYSVKVLNEENTAPLSRIIRGIYWCVENDMDIINMSFGTPVYSRALEQAVTDAYEAGLLMVGAAGNGSSNVEYPAAFPEVMAVAATGTDAQLSDFSNTGEELDIAAPGEKVRVASFFGGSTVTHGTSIAVPHVTGVASLLWEKDRTKSNEFIRQLIDSSAKAIEGTDDCGLLDAQYALDCYDAFAESFDEIKNLPREELPENSEEPEVFDEVDTDETYVEGLWNWRQHQYSVSYYATTSGLTTAAVAIIKEGVIFPDKPERAWHGAKDNPRWHGRWKRRANDGGGDVNYAAVFEMVTEVALEGGNIRSYMTRDWFDGMDSKTYNQLKSDINSLKNEYAFYYPGGTADTAENRKYFLYGCGIHAAQDVFSHSTATKNGNEIEHTGGADDADEVTHYKRRILVANRLTQLALYNLANNSLSNGEEMLQALKDEYQTATFKMFNVKKYINANGYTGAILNTVTIDK